MDDADRRDPDQGERMDPAEARALAVQEGLVTPRRASDDEEPPR